MRILRVCKFIFTARFARVTEDPENNNFSIAVERTAMEKHSAAYAAETTIVINSLVARCKYGHIITRRVVSFCFSASQRKAKKKHQKLCDLCGSAVNNFLLKNHLWTDTISQTKLTPCCKETPHPVQYTHLLFVPESSRFHFFPQRAASAA